MTIKDVTAKFKKQLNYHEKKSLKDLFTDKNNGSNNYTKYAYVLKNTDLLNGNKQAVAWCCVFIIACFYDMFGADLTHKILKLPKKSAAAGCSFFYSYLSGTYINTKPQEGDIIFFGSGKPSHVGYIYKVSNTKVYTIEGNSSNAVKKHSYKYNNKKIFGYGRPDYSYIKDIIYKEGLL